MSLKMIVWLVILVVVAIGVYYLTTSSVEAPSTSPSTTSSGPRGSEQAPSSSEIQAPDSQVGGAAVEQAQPPVDSGVQTPPPKVESETAMPKEENVVPATPAAVNVEIKNFSFSPASLRIKVGTKVIWTNQDLAGHTATSDSGAFGSSLLAQGQSFGFTFSQKGTFSYHCTPHPFMVATVIVE